MSRERNDQRDERREEQQQTDLGTGHGVPGQGGQDTSRGVPEPVQPPGADADPG